MVLTLAFVFEFFLRWCLRLRSFCGGAYACVCFCVLFAVVLTLAFVFAVVLTLAFVFAFTLLTCEPRRR